MKIKSILILIPILIISYFYISNQNRIIQKEYNYDVTIYRDVWGVPHIYGKKDTDTAFGLAYAHAEDDFKTIQDVLLTVRGTSASVKGKEAAPIDYLVGMLKVWQTVNEKYEARLKKAEAKKGKK